MTSSVEGNASGWTPRTCGADTARPPGEAAASGNVSALAAASLPRVSLLTAGYDKPYALGLTEALTSKGVELDFIGGVEQDAPQLHNARQVRVFNFRVDGRPGGVAGSKLFRLLAYYARLVPYAARTKAKVFHILWNYRLELLDRTLLMLYYKLLGKRVVFTAHNVNAAARDQKDSWLNRVSLRVQYRLCDHIFVHTNKMKSELLAQFGVLENRVSVIRFGMNNTVPVTPMTAGEAKQRLGISKNDKTLLFFGNIAAYKGLEYLIEAFANLSQKCSDYRLIIAGKPKGADEYWTRLQGSIARCQARDRILQRIEFIPDAQTELYFKAADVLVLPYTDIFQSGVLFLGYAFGLPVIATDVGSLREDIIEGETGLICKPNNAPDLSKSIEQYFSHALYANLESRRSHIQRFAGERYSWASVGQETCEVYSRLCAN